MQPWKRDNLISAITMTVIGSFPLPTLYLNLSLVILHNKQSIVTMEDHGNEEGTCN